MKWISRVRRRVRDRVLKSPLTEIKTSRGGGGVREDLLLHLGADYFFIHDAARGRATRNGRTEKGRSGSRGLC